MAQFDVYDNPSAPQRAAFPYYVVLQSDQLDRVSTRLVMPLARAPAPPASAPRRLTQAVTVGSERLFLAPHLVAALPNRLLRHSVASLKQEAAVIIDALDAVVSGV